MPSSPHPIQPDPSNSQPLTLQELAASLTHFAAWEIDSELDIVSLKAGDTLFEQGAEPDGIYILIAGLVGVRVADADGVEIEISQLKPGAIVGEMGALSGQKRAARVVALEDSEMFFLNSEAYKGVMSHSPEVEQVVAQEMGDRWQMLQLSRVIRRYIGEDADMATFEAWAEQVEWLRLSNGDVVFRQGDAPDGMYIVINGRLRIVAETPAGQKQEIAEITPGETVGEFALLTGDPRSATVFAVRETNLIRISNSMFQNLARVNPHFMTEITKAIVVRQQRMLDQGKPQAPTALSIALVPAGPSAEVTPFAQQLAAAMQTYGGAQALDAVGFDQLFGKSGASQAASDDAVDGMVTRWLDELESNQAFVIYAADAEPTAWTRRCLGRADRVLILADPADDPTPGSAEVLAASFEVPVRSELVLWHSAETRQPSGTAKWLDLRNLFAHHHIQRDNPGHMARLARRLTGHAIALVFSGGGALGYAELGVYKAMLELGIPIDYLGGTSMGSIMTAGIACGFSYPTMEEHAQTLDATGVMDLTLPVASLTASKNVSEMMQTVFGEYQIEDLWIPFFCVSTSFTYAEKMVHQRGPLWRAIRASMAVPGVFLPVVENGNVLVDGGIMDNFPVGTMVALAESDSVIGVHISPYRERRREYDYDTSLSGWAILRSRLNPLSKPLRVPSLMQTLTQASLVSGMRFSKQEESLVDLMITPNVKQFGFSDYDKWRELADEGYKTGLEPLRAWKAQRMDLA